MDLDDPPREGLDRWDIVASGVTAATVPLAMCKDFMDRFGGEWIRVGLTAIHNRAPLVIRNHGLSDVELSTDDLLEVESILLTLFNS